MSTITVPACVPSVHEDVEHLHKAFEGWGTNEDLIISILAHRNAAQRKAIRHAYAEKYGVDLLKALDKELTSKFERIVYLWTLDSAERDAYLANEATQKWTSSNQVLVEIACTRSPKELILVREAYHARYKKSLEEDVYYHTKDDFRKLLVPLVSSYKCWDDEADLHLAKTEAKHLHEKICAEAYADDEVIRILTTRSRAQINATLNQYKHIFGNDIEKDLDAGSKNDFVALLNSTIQCLAYPEKYFEKVLHDAISGIGTDEGALTRVVTTRAEIDLKIILDEYHRKNSVTLDKAIIKETHGDYEKILLALIGQEPEHEPEQKHKPEHEHKHEKA